MNYRKEWTNHHEQQISKTKTKTTHKQNYGFGSV